MRPPWLGIALVLLVPAMAWGGLWALCWALSCLAAARRLWKEGAL